MLAEKRHNSLFMLQWDTMPRYIWSTPSTDSLQLNVMAEDIGHAPCNRRYGSGRTVLPLEGV
jgi:hypothetical protein